jgi:hypothetical protein
MKLMHSTTTVLNTKEFNQLSEKMIDALYDLNPDIKDLYDIHINYIDDEWAIDFLPLVDDIPVIKINTYVEQHDNGREILKAVPANLTDIPGILKFKDDNGSYDLCMNYVAVFEFILGLYDFEYRLN